MAKEFIILSPFTGKVKELKDVSDPVFAEGMIGQGLAVAPEASETEALSPVAAGKVVSAFPTGHAYGIATKFAELLIHIGIDTVTLDGEGFEVMVKPGDKLKANTTLAKVDLVSIAKKAPSTDTMVLVTNESIGNLKIERIAGDTVKAGEPLFKLVK